MKKSKISIIVPTKNEEGNLEQVLSSVSKYADELIVVDGQSTDRTVSIAERYKAKVIIDSGLGKGAALRLAAEKSVGDVLVFIDADWSHNPSDIPLLLNPILNGDADHVSGSRMLGGSDELFSSLSEFIRLVGSEIITLSIGKRYGMRLTDTQNGFRCIRREVFFELNLKENITTIEQEMVVQTLRRGYRLIEVPTHEYRRNAGKSNITVWKVGFRYVWCLIRNISMPILKKVPSNMAEIQEKYRSRWTLTEVKKAYRKTK